MLVLNQITTNDLDNEKALNAYTDVKVITFNKDKIDDFNTKIIKNIVKHNQTVYEFCNTLSC
jgi:hypothetical protein